ncbi:MAG: ABC transporter permease [Clostridiales bacterium]|nr:ABC transporter permease [Clostridiales bacterium]
MAIIAILIMSVVFTLTSPYFLTWENWKNILLQTSTVSVAAMGQAIVLLTGNFDLSLGRNVAFTSCLGAILMKSTALSPNIWNPWVVILIMLAMGTLIGLCNGVLTAYAGLPAFIATLGLQNVCYGLAKLITNATPIATFPNSIAFFGRRYFGPMPWCVLIMIGLYILAQFLSTKTRLGRNIYAVGGGKEAAFFSGINVKKYTCLGFVIAGFLASFSGVILMSRLNSVAITNGQGYEFDAVIGSIIGGVSLAGGKGKIIGTLFGSIFLITLFNGMAQLHVDPFVQDVLKGFVLLAAIGLDVFRNRKRA